MKLIISAILFAISSLATAQEVEKPNIIFIFADDWGYGDIGAHGSTFCKTPQLDKMIKEGTSFRNFSVVNPVCSPSRVAVMTGHYPARHSVHGHFSNVASHIDRNMPDWLDPNAVQLPRILKNAGYKTAHYGKWHLTSRTVSDAPLPDQYGYDEYKAFNVPGPEALTASAIPDALQFIETNKDVPFFINLWIHETHLPHYPLEEYLNLHPNLTAQQKVYAAVVSEGDAGVGKVLDKLKELNLDKNTLVIFSSDNGPEWTGTTKTHKDGLGKFYSIGETAGLKGRKRSLYAGGVRVPFIVWWPGTVPAGKVTKSTAISSVDLLPTFAGIGGATLPENYEPDGEDITKLLKGGSFKRSKPIYWQWKFPKSGNITWPGAGIRDGKWRLLYQGNRTALYDMTSDLAEKKNLASENPDVVDRLKKKTNAWIRTLPTSASPDSFSSSR